MNAERRKNLLILMTDQHSRRVTGCYGDRVVRTPALDALAADSLVFDDAYCPAPLCVPSRMSFLTGRFPHRNRVLDNSHMLSSSLPTWAHALGAVGYETALMGKMHFVGTDHRHGFELRPLGEFLGRHPGVPEVGGPRWTRFSSGTSGQQRVSVETVGTGTTTYQWFDRRVADTGIRYLEEVSRRGGRQRPFAAVVSFNLPHCPFIAPRELYEYYLDRVEMPVIDAEVPPTVRRFQERRRLVDPPVAPEQIRHARAAYYALTEHVDSLIGEVLAALDRTGLAEDTVVVYCADHGEHAGEHGCWWKSLYYEEAAAVPLIVRDPDSPRRGERSRAIVNLADLAATICDIAGTGLPGIDGRSFAPVLDDPARETEYDTTFCELYDPKSERKGGVASSEPLLSRMVRQGRYKYWRFFDSAGLPPVLFDLDNDPEEQRDLSGDPAHARTVERLDSLLTEGWDPTTVRRAAEEETEAFRVFRSYGEAVRPECSETLEVPPASIEADVELI